MQTDQPFEIALPPDKKPRVFKNLKDIVDSNITSSFTVSKIKVCTSKAGQTTGILLQLKEWEATKFGNNPMNLSPIGDVTNKNDNCQVTNLESPIKVLQIGYDKLGLNRIKFS
jgi:hypothetical protein